MIIISLLIKSCYCCICLNKKSAFTRTKLSVNINKVATIRNARGGSMPDVVKFAVDCESFGAQGITVHPRPDERHINYKDVYNLRPNSSIVSNSKFNSILIAFLII